jgi:hypothetical protein
VRGEPAFEGREIRTGQMEPELATPPENILGRAGKFLAAQVLNLARV